MSFLNYNNFLKILLLILTFFGLNGCDSFLSKPYGFIAIEECSLIFISFMMMLLVVVPVIFMTFYFSVKYRINNVNQIYKPNWCDSKKIEIIVWTIPVLIISFLAFLSWHYTHKLDPRRSIVSLYKPIKIDAIALDWKWLFIYPDYHIATINEILFPVNRPISFRITSNSVMNSFFIPALGSQIYAMPGMVTELNLISNTPGEYKGISSNYSGRGFSDMKFSAISVLKNDMFVKWIKKINNSSKKLNNINIFNTISIPNENHPVEYFSNVQKDLFNQIIDKYSIKNVKIMNLYPINKILINSAKVEK